MEVEIITEHKPAKKQMTVEDLCGERFIGIEADGGEKFMFALTALGTIFNFIKAGGCWASYITKYKLLKRVTEDRDIVEIHVFPTAKDLYLWMAE